MALACDGRQYKCIFTLFIALILLPTTLSAEPTYQNNWYLGIHSGLSQTDISHAELDTAYQNISLTYLDISKQSTFYQVSVGYGLNHIFSFELGYLDLGKREISYSGLTTDLNTFHQQVSPAYVDTGKGVTTNLLLTVPVYSNLKATAMIGVFNWQNKFSLNNQVGQSLQVEQSGRSLSYGAELKYQFTDRLQLYSRIEQVNMKRHKVMNSALGIRYFFDMPTWANHTSSDIKLAKTSTQAINPPNQTTHTEQPTLRQVSLAKNDSLGTKPVLSDIETTKLNDQDDNINLVDQTITDKSAQKIDKEKSLNKSNQESLVFVQDISEAESTVQYKTNLDFRQTGKLNLDFKANTYKLQKYHLEPLARLTHYIRDKEQAHILISAGIFPLDKSSLQQRARQWRVHELTQYFIRQGLLIENISIDYKELAGFSLEFQQASNKTVNIETVTFKAYSDWLSSSTKKLILEAISKHASNHSQPRIHLISTRGNQTPFLGSVELTANRAELIKTIIQQKFPAIPVTVNYIVNADVQGYPPNQVSILKRL